MYRFAVRVLIADWEGCELWATIFDQTAAKFLGFSANAYVSMTSDAHRYAAFSLLVVAAAARESWHGHH